MDKRPQFMPPSGRQLGKELNHDLEFDDVGPGRLAIGTFVLVVIMALLGSAYLVINAWHAEQLYREAIASQRCEMQIASALSSEHKRWQERTASAYTAGMHDAQVQQRARSKVAQTTQGVTP